MSDDYAAVKLPFDLVSVQIGSNHFTLFDHKRAIGGVCATLLVHTSVLVLIPFANGGGALACSVDALGRDVCARASCHILVEAVNALLLAQLNIVLEDTPTHDLHCCNRRKSTTCLAVSLVSDIVAVVIIITVPVFSVRAVVHKCLVVASFKFHCRVGLVHNMELWDGLCLEKFARVLASTHLLW